MGSKSNQGSGLISRNIKVLEKRTSVRLEKQMWKALKDIAEYEDCSIHDLCSLVSMNKTPDLSLTASIRIFIMMYFKAAATEEGHKRAGHGNFSSMLKRAKMLSAQSGAGHVRKVMAETPDAIYTPCEAGKGFQRSPNYHAN